MIAVELSLIIFVTIFVAAALVIFNIRQGKADQEMRLVRLEYKIHALLTHLGIPDDAQNDAAQELLRRERKP